MHVKSKITQNILEICSVPCFWQEPFCCEEKMERSGQLKYIPRKEVERNFGNSDGLPTFPNSQMVVKNSLLVY